MGFSFLALFLSSSVSDDICGISLTATAGRLVPSPVALPAFILRFANLTFFLGVGTAAGVAGSGDGDLGAGLGDAIPSKNDLSSTSSGTGSAATGSGDFALCLSLSSISNDDNCSTAPTPSSPFSLLALNSSLVALLNI